MRRQKRLAQVRTCDVRVDRRRRDALVTEQLLDGTQVAPTLDEVRREGVA
jgi:hypothetical protein